MEARTAEEIDNEIWIVDAEWTNVAKYRNTLRSMNTIEAREAASEWDDWLETQRQVLMDLYMEYRETTGESYWYA